MKESIYNLHLMNLYVLTPSIIKSTIKYKIFLYTKRFLFKYLITEKLCNYVILMREYSIYLTFKICVVFCMSIYIL